MAFTLDPYTDTVIDTFRGILPKDAKEWQLIGIVNKDHDVFTFGNDSKIVGRAFEVVATSYIKDLAQTLGYEFHESTSQTVYPDFILVKPNGKKIAIDVKSTYRKIKSDGTTVGKFNFTLGSFTSFLRTGTKNIHGDYADYDSHYVLAFLYSRTNRFDTTKVNIDDIDQVDAAYDQVEVMFTEKYRISGDKKGSGNTDNIGTISTNCVEVFNYGYGPFAALGNDVYEHYWRNYPRYTMSKEERNTFYSNLPEYFSWLSKQNDSPFDESDLRKKYAEYKTFMNDKGYEISLT